MMAPPTLVIGLDYGTTYSGFAYGLYADNIDYIAGKAVQKVELYETQEWPSQTTAYQKAPTALLYQGSKMIEEKWGWPAVLESSTPETFFVQRTKLHLSPKDAPQSFNPAVDAPLPPGVTPIQAIADYLRAMKMFVFKMIAKSGVAVNEMSTRWCLTVPAIWTYYAKDVMEEAAQMAGLIRGPKCPTGQGSSQELVIVPEPEAASLYCLQKLKEAAGNKVDMNAAYLLVDLGGGTADLVAHGYMEGRESIVELTKGSGALCGGSLLDDLFFQEIMPTIIPTWADVAKKFPKEAQICRTTWAHLKKGFNGKNPRLDFSLPSKLGKFVDQSKYPDVEDDDAVGIPSSQISAIFFKILVMIETLINDQIKLIKEAHPTKAIVIFLVGGLSESPFVQQHLLEKYSASYQMITPPAPGIAVARGAVLYGLKYGAHIPPPIAGVPNSGAPVQPIISSIARVSIGFEVLRDTRAGDPAAHITNVQGKSMTKAIYALMTSGKPVPEAWKQTSIAPANAYDTKITLPLYTCPNANSPWFPSTPGTTKLGEVQVLVPQAADKTIVVSFNFTGATIKLRASPVANAAATVDVSLKIADY